MRVSTVVVLTFSLLATAPSALAQRAGQSARINVGIVERAENVQLDSEAGRGALVGGALGWGLARNQSSGRQAAAALGGAALGRGSANRRQGDRSAIRYTIRTGEGSAIQVVTDQTEIRIGDCVLVEETSNGANVRRKDPAMCQPTSEQVMAQVEDDLQEDASRCDDAKERLFDATTPEEVEIARQVMDILCNN
jgi:outer membrane lipoprotein SlyB